MIFTRKKAPPRPPEPAKRKAEPSQQELLAEALRPGREVSLAMSTDMVNEFIDVRASMLHDITEDGLLILAQPSQPLDKHSLGRVVDVTFLVPHPDRGAEHLRLGYKTRVQKLVDGWQVGPGFSDNVVLVPKPKKLERTTLRLHYRVEPTSEVPLQLTLVAGGPALALLDLSVGGARFTHSPLLDLDHGQTIDLHLRGENFFLELRAVVLRTTRTPLMSSRTPATSAVKFIDHTPEAKNRLSRLINEIARLQRAKETCLGD